MTDSLEVQQWECKAENSL